MHTFKDGDGHEWELSLDLPKARKLRDKIGVNLLDGGAGLEKLAADGFLLLDAIYLLCEPQATAAGINEEQFQVALSDGDAILEASDALMEELSRFIPKRHRQTFQMALQKMREERETPIPTTSLPTSQTAGNASGKPLEQSAGVGAT